VLASAFVVLSVWSGCSSLPVGFGPSYRLKFSNYAESPVSVSFRLTSESGELALSDEFRLDGKETFDDPTEEKTYSNLEMGEQYTLEVSASGDSVERMTAVKSFTIGGDQRVSVAIWSDEISIAKLIPSYGRACHRHVSDHRLVGNGSRAGRNAPADADSTALPAAECPVTR